MQFITDKQTLTDLNLLGKYKTGSLFNLFNRVKTRGGELLLEEMFRSPLTSSSTINDRSAKIRYIQEAGISLFINWEHIEMASQYLAESRPGNEFSSFVNCYIGKTKEVLYRSTKYQLEQKHILAVQELLLSASNLLGQLIKKEMPENPCRDLQERLSLAVNEPSIRQLKAKYPYTIQQSAHCQYLFRGKCRDLLTQMLHTIYEFDVYISVAQVASEKNLVFAVAKANTGTGEIIEASNLSHPALNNAKGNDVTLNKGSNLMFLTGANMAGKSTWMKTLGISFYLAHMGFPVKADRMGFEVMDGVLTSINVPDDLSLGWSHFYAEVMRVKHVAEQVSSGKKLFVLFDELFKGTNVKDAYDATLAVTRKLAAYDNCAFVVSTHIIEVGDALRDMDNIQFKYLPTIMVDSVPHYTYQLAEGITNDRQGMIIIENERILEMLG